MKPSLGLLKRSIETLKTWQPDLAVDIEQTGCDPRIVPTTARDGAQSLVARPAPAAQEVLLHSKYGPLREAQRAVERMNAAATLIGFGAGGLHVPRAYLTQHPMSSVVVVEPSFATVRTVLATIDVIDILRSGRLRFATSTSQLKSELERVHQPLIRDGILFSELRPWTQLAEHREAFDVLIESAHTAARSIAGEYATLIAYGRRWLSHTVANSLQMDWRGVREATARLSDRAEGKDIRIYAAGPSLDTWLDSSGAIDLSNDRTFSVATDTAVPALTGRGRRADAIVTLDPQGWSELHFRKRRNGSPRRPAETLLFDIGSAPVRGDAKIDLVPFGSNHPLHRILSDAGFPLLPSPNADNVTIAAVDLLGRLGAGSISVVGDDSGYPAAVTYARGTYHYGIADRHADRLRPSETFFSSNVYPRCTIEPWQKDQDRPFFRVPGMEQTAVAIDKRIKTAMPYRAGRSTSGEIMDPVQFWTEHVSRIDALTDALTDIDSKSTVEILSLLGRDGRAHLPAIASLHNTKRSNASGTLPLSESVVRSLLQIRSFIFSHLCRYSN